MSQKTRSKAHQTKNKKNSLDHDIRKKMRKTYSMDLIDALLMLRNQPSRQPLHSSKQSEAESKFIDLTEIHSRQVLFLPKIYMEEAINIQKCEKKFIYKCSSHDKHSNYITKQNRPLPIGRPLPPAPELPEKITR
jgi:hypothetical protein